MTLVFEDWNSLRTELQFLTEKHGARAALAREFGISRQAVNAWLSGKSQPSAEITLRLLKWVEQEEAKQKTVQALRTLARRKTRIRNTSHDKPHSGPRKR